jgi:rhodanese-related sulfurtransferase
MTVSKVPVWSPAALHQRLDSASRIASLDVRNGNEFATWHIEGRAPIPTLNVP